MDRIRNVSTTARHHLCVSCEACVVICPVGAIETRLRDGQPVPVVDEGRCTDCGRCVRLCPGLDVSHRGAVDREDVEEGVLAGVRSAYEAQALDDECVARGTSGGFITRLLTALIDSGEYEGAFVLSDSAGTEDAPALSLASSSEEVLGAAGSKYVPASIRAVLRTLSEDRESRFVIVGTPCQMSALDGFMAMKRIDRERLLLVGLFCDRTMNLNFAHYLEDRFGRDGERLIACAHRSKEAADWPGELKLTFSSGRTVSVNRSIRMDAKSYFQLKRCTLCADKFNLRSDLSVGDCYVPGRGDRRGRSNVLVFSEKGEDVLRRYEHLFLMTGVDAATVTASQRAAGRGENLRRARDVGEREGLDLLGGIRLGRCRADARTLESELRDLCLGRAGNSARVRRAAAVSRFGKRVDRLVNRLAVASTMLFAALRVRLFHRGPAADRPGGRNVLMIGATFDNKGAQGMIFAVMDEVSRRCPDASFAILSANELVVHQAERYRLTVAPWTVGIKSAFVGGPGRLVDDPLPRARSEVKAVRDLVANASCFVDISGFRLGSEWGIGNTLDYLLNLLVARILNVPYYVLPQSLGPFEYRGWRSWVVSPILRTALRSARVVFAREDQGYSATLPYVRGNLVRAGDIVLGSAQDKAENVYREGHGPCVVRIEAGTVGIVPSAKVFERLGDDAESLYRAVLDRLKNANRRVCFVAHSAEDAVLCERVLDSYPGGGDIPVLGADMDAIELEELLGSLEFIVASRFHSVVHAYRRGVPAVVVGWAAKYRELAEAFGQGEYVFDVRSGLAIEDVVATVGRMLDRAAEESGRIASGARALDNSAVFERVKACPAGDASASGSEHGWRRYAAWGVIAVCVALLVVDVAQMRRDWMFTPPKFAGDDYLAVAGSRKSANAANIVIGIAVREAAGDRPPSTLVMPEDLDSLRAPISGWGGATSQALSHGTVKQLTAGNLETRKYDPVLSNARLSELTSDAEVREYAHDVVVLVPSDAEVTEFALATDAQKRVIYIVPLRDMPEASER